MHRKLNVSLLLLYALHGNHLDLLLQYGPIRLLRILGNG